MDEFLVGTCQLKLKDLIFESGRDRLAGAVDQLMQVFPTSCNPIDKENQIPVVVSPDELQEILGASGITMQDLIGPSSPLPKLRPPRPLRCIHGRQRYEAALQVEGPGMWWAVRVFCIPPGSDVTRLLFKEVDQHYYQTPPSDGDVFRKVREYTEDDRPDAADLWRARLSKGKRLALRALELRPTLLDKLDQLRCFPGLWQGFHLGCVEKHLALHAIEEMVHYLQHTYEVWDKITVRDPSARQAVDNETVQNLELRVPALSTDDAAAVQNLMASGTLFRHISDTSLRVRLQERILETKCLIPSLRTFHENVRYLGIGIKIIRELVIDDLGGRSVSAAMRDCWDSNSSSSVEVTEGMYHQVAERHTHNLAYYQVLLAALRYFPRLSTTPPRCERKQQAVEAGVDDVFVTIFSRGVHQQGFRSQKLTKALSRSCPLGPLSAPTGEGQLLEASRNRRCGRPFADSYKYLAKTMFLPGCVAAHERTRYPSAIFVHVDIMNSFLPSPNANGLLVRPIDLANVVSEDDMMLESPKGVAPGFPRTNSVSRAAHIPATASVLHNFGDNTSVSWPADHGAGFSQELLEDISGATSHSVRSIIRPLSDDAESEGPSSSRRPPNDRRFGMFLPSTTAVPGRINIKRSNFEEPSFPSRPPTSPSVSSARSLVEPYDLYGMGERFASPSYSDSAVNNTNTFVRELTPQNDGYFRYPSSVYSTSEGSVRTIFGPGQS